MASVASPKTPDKTTDSPGKIKTNSGSPLSPIPPDLKQPDNATTEHLSNIILALGKKLAAMGSKDAELEHLRYLLQTAEQARNDVRNSLLEAADNVKYLHEKERNALKTAIEENEQLKKDNAEINEIKEKQEKDIAELKNMIEALEAEKAELQIETKREQEKDIAATNSLFEEIIKRKDQLEKSYKTTLENTEKMTAQHTESLETALKENRELNEAVLQHKKEILKLQSDFKTTEVEKERLKVSLQKLTSELELAKDAIYENEKYKALIYGKDGIILSLKDEINKVKSEISEIHIRLANDSEILQQKYENKCREVKAKAEEKDQLDLLYKELTSENFTLKNKVSSYEQLICVSEDMNSKIDGLENTISLLTNEKKKLEKELELAGTQLENMENKCYSFEKTIQKLQQSIKAKDLEISTLVNTVKDLKLKLRVYVPVKGDVIDNKLADLLNNLPNAQGLGTMFARESEGVYKFGTKRIFAKIEQDKVIIRVGGGFLNFDEFLEVYGPGEIDKVNKVK